MRQDRRLEGDENDGNGAENTGGPLLCSFKERKEPGVGKSDRTGVFRKVGTAMVSSCHYGEATSDAGAGVTGFGSLACDGNRLGTQMITFF